MMTIGVDPGLTGAVCFLDDADILEVLPLPTVALEGEGLIKRRIDGEELYRMVDAHVPDGARMQVFCENVKAIGGIDNAIQTQASLVRTLGAIESVFDILGCPRTLIEPQTWQRFYGLIGKAAEKRVAGELPAAVRMAQRLFPDCGLHKVGDHNKAEALLIAHYGRRHAA